MKFRCVYNNNSDVRLTIGKLYDAIIDEYSKELYDKHGIIYIIDNLGDKVSYFIKSDSEVWFENNIAEERDKKINKLINK